MTDTTIPIELVERDSIPREAQLPTVYEDSQIRAFHEAATGYDHVALTLGDMSGPDPVLIRLHLECLTGDVLASLLCDCGTPLQYALEYIVTHRRGCMPYSRHNVCRLYL